MPVTINLKFDDTRLLTRLRNGQKRLAFAVVNALNATAKKVQEAERARVKQEFVVRKTEFIERQAAIIKPFASVREARPFVVISVGQKNRLLLADFERGALRKPFVGKRVAVPVVGGARPSRSAPVKASLEVRKLRFRRQRASTKAARRRRRAGAVGKIWVGQQNTYLVPGTGIFQRQAGGRSRALYIFTDPFMLDRRLRFEETARRVISKEFVRIWRREIRKTLEFQASRR